MSFRNPQDVTDDVQSGHIRIGTYVHPSDSFEHVFLIETIKEEPRRLFSIWLSANDRAFQVRYKDFVQYTSKG